jgi:DNA invertase Pin-like site-specific DNA recombinase
MVIDTGRRYRSQLGYARVSRAHQSLDQQMDALTAAGVDATRV